MSKQHSYGLYIVRNSGERETVLEKEKDFERIRRVALRIKQRPGRKLIITRDNKACPVVPRPLTVRRTSGGSN